MSKKESIFYLAFLLVIVFIWVNNGEQMHSLTTELRVGMLESQAKIGFSTTQPTEFQKIISFFKSPNQLSERIIYNVFRSSTNIIQIMP